MGKTKLRIIQVINVKWFNATAWYALELSRLLNDSGHTVLVITLKNTEPYYQAIKMGLVPFCLPLNTFNPIVFFKLVQELKKLISTFNPHIVNCHRGEAFFIWSLLRNFGNYALIRTRGDQRKPKATLCNKFLHRYMTDAIVVTNSCMEKHFSSIMHIPKEHIYTILGGVDTNKFYFSEEARQEIRSKYGFNSSHCVIGLLGRFDKVKGQKELIDIIASLIQEGYTNIRLLLIGFPTDITQKEIDSWIHNAGIKEYVITTGKIQDVPGYLSALDIGIVASLWSETIARAALEMMACKRPLISTNVGVMPDLLPKEALVDPKDSQALMQLLKKTISDGGWRGKLIEICYKRIQDLTSSLFLTRTLDVYEKALYARLRAGKR